LLSKVDLKSKKILGTKETLAFIKAEKPELLVTIGAGDIDRIVEPITQILST